VIVCEVYFRMWCTEEEVEQKVQEWNMSTNVKQTSALTCRIRSTSAVWVADVVWQDPDVAHVEIIRIQSERTTP